MFQKLRFYVLVMSLSCLLTGCAVPSGGVEHLSEPDTVQDVSVLESMPPIQEREKPPTESSSKGNDSEALENYVGTMMPIPNEDIYSFAKEYQNDLLIAVKKDGVFEIMRDGLCGYLAFQDSYTMGIVPLGRDIDDLLSGLGSRLATLDLETMQVYESNIGLVSGVWPNISFLDNGLIVSSDGYRRPIFLNKQCEPVPNPLQFDYGLQSSSGDSDGEGNDEYWIIALTYDTEAEIYVAVFSKNPYFGSAPGEDFDNTICALGIAVFDKDGTQTQRFMLDGTLHPLNINQMKNAARLPLIYLIEDNTVLIVPQSGESQAYATRAWEKLDGYTAAPIIVNLENRSFTQLNDDETQFVLDSSTTLMGELDRNYKYWHICKQPQEHPFELTYENDMLTVLRSNDELPLFSLPEGYNMTLYYEYNDVEYLAFSRFMNWPHWQ